MISSTLTQLLEAFSTLLQACNALLHLQQRLFGVAAKALHNLVQNVDYGLQQLDPGLGLPHVPILPLQGHAELTIIRLQPGSSLVQCSAASLALVHHIQAQNLGTVMWVTG